ncbi:MAG TPA: OmpA family protein [Elusimicrobiota bacterium]|nr:OmpA family protein [Elusimicrobiota bacterium]
MRNTGILVSALVLVLAGCVTPGRDTAVGGATGAAGGAGLGAIIGHQFGNEAGGALIGAALGGALGTVIGNHFDKQSRELAALADTQRTQNGILTKLKNDLLFDVGSADLKPDAKDNLAQIGGIIAKYPEDRVEVVGYTDSTGSQAFNQTLSQNRANSVKLALINSGVPSSSIEAIGQGESNPIGDNSTAEGRAQNRRVELVITADPSKVHA